MKKVLLSKTCQYSFKHFHIFLRTKEKMEIDLLSSFRFRVRLRHMQIQVGINGTLNFPCFDMLCLRNPLIHIFSRINGNIFLLETLRHD